MKFTNEQVLYVTTIVEVLGCGECRTACRSMCMVFLGWLFSGTLINCDKFYLCEAHFHAELIGANPVISASN